MITMFNDDDINDVAELEKFLAAAEVFGTGFLGTRQQRAEWISERLRRFKYKK